MVSIAWEAEAWAEQNFGECELGDRRRNKRLVKYATQVVAKPDGSTLDQAEKWGDVKAVYRLMNVEDVMPAAIIAPHCRTTRAACQTGQVKLIVNDTTELDYTSLKKTTGLGPIGNGHGRGFFAHSALMVDAATHVVDGLAAQELFHRRPCTSRKKCARNTTRRSESRESAVWGRVIDAVGAPPEGVKWLHVCDRGADDFEVFHRAIHQCCGFVIRAARLNRKVQTLDGRELRLAAVLNELPWRGEREVEVPAKGKQPKRTACLTLRHGLVKLPRPRTLTPWLKNHPGAGLLTLNVVELIELDPPANCQRIRWILYTTEPANSVAAADLVIEYYECRWTVEDYHKCWKTGCQVESRQYTTADSLERIAAVSAVVAVRLLQMRTAAKETPDRPADEIAPKEWINMLCAIRKIRNNDRLTIREFVRQLAGLGGFLMRKRDGEPGWITLWRGTEKLILCLRGAEALRKSG
jgi:hypothetical protein